MIADYGWTGTALSWVDLPALRKVSSPSWSIIGAIALADHLGATDIRVYGWDMAVDQPNATEPCLYPKDRRDKELAELADLRRAIAATITLENTNE